MGILFALWLRIVVFRELVAGSLERGSVVEDREREIVGESWLWSKGI